MEQYLVQLFGKVLSAFYGHVTSSSHVSSKWGKTPREYINPKPEETLVIYKNIF